MSTATDTHQKPNVHEMIVIHRVFRREFSSIPGLVGRTGGGDIARARIVGGHAQLILAGLHMHHTGEDIVLWPRLLERAAPSTGLVETMQSQHQRVDDCAKQLETLVGEWTGTGDPAQGAKLAGFLGDFGRLLFEHLDLEEHEVLPLISRYISADEWATLGDHGRRSMSGRQLPLMFGSILEEADDAERAEMLAVLPVPVRLAMRTVGARQYRRYINRVRAC